MIKQIEGLLFQLHDVSEYINYLSNSLSKDYDYYSNVLSCACIEEKYIINELEIYLNNYFGLDTKKKGWFTKPSRITINHDHPNNKYTILGHYYDYFHYYFNMPRNVLKQEYSIEFIQLKNLFEKVKEETKDIDCDTVSLGIDKYTELFRLQNRHHDFNTDEWLRENKVEVDFI